MELSKTFRLDETGYVLLQELILERIEKDIDNEEKELDIQKDKEMETIGKSGFLILSSKIE